MRKALRHQQELHTSLTALLLRREGSGLVQSDTVKAVQGARRDLDGLSSFFSTFLNPVFYNERILESSDGESTAQKVFAIAELLELILGRLTIRDIISFYQVSRAVYIAIEGSPRLQRVLSLRADAHDSHFRTPFGDYSHGPKGGFYCGNAGHPIQVIVDGARQTHRLTFRAGFKRCAKALPSKIGTRWRRMFICQPPVHEVTISCACCSSKYKHTELRKLRSESGVTIGDLYDMTETLVTEHRTCVYASALQHDEAGVVIVNPTFSATMDLGDSDPIVQAWRRSITPGACPTFSHRTDFLSQQFLNRRARQDRLQAYINYKRRAYAEGEPVLLLSELEATGWSEYSTTDEEGVLYSSAITLWRVESTMGSTPQPVPVVLPVAVPAEAVSEQ
ncbi:hypothetical protein LTR36_002733 [Oleoguttula mirabilis]|uniref:DDE Tnp4 domain-containing protein n=1 Tax=Oleoguttula mirabilis TaxID=1507867 RepID=A0AAV9JLL4_9PEZI|nr:hypothetical protein LTR36_002733 [Oleoguttula mirabilis]